VTGVGGDHIRIEIADHRRAAELASQPVAEGAEDRPVLPTRGRTGRPGSDPLCLPEEVSLAESGQNRQRGSEGDSGRDQLGVDDLRPRDSDGADGACNPLTVVTYLRNRSSQVTLYRTPDGSTRDGPERGRLGWVRKTEFSDPSFALGPGGSAAGDCIRGAGILV
jgi:hypothetical protein